MIMALYSKEDPEYTILFQYITTLHTTIQFNTLQYNFQYLILVQHNTLLQYVCVQSLYNSSTIVQLSLSLCIVYSLLTVVYCTTLMYITSLYMYCIVDITHDKYTKLHVM